MTPLEAAADAAEEAMRAISACEGEDGMSYSIIDALAEARGETELEGASDVLRDASLDVARAAISAYLKACAEDEARDALAEIVERVAADGLPEPRALDAAIDAILAALEPGE